MTGFDAPSIGSCRSLGIDSVKKYQDYEIIIAKVGLISSAFTLFATGTIILFIVCKRIYSNIQVKPLLHLSISDFLLSLLWVSSSAIYLTSDKVHMQQKKLMSCFLWQLTTEVIHLVTFCFTVNYSINVYLLMKEREQRVYMDYSEHVHGMNSSSARKLEAFKKSLYYISWCLPILIMLPVFIYTDIKHISACQKCVILIDVPRLVNKVSPFMQAYGFLVLAVSLPIAIIAIMTLYCLTLKLYWKAIPAYHTNRQRRQLLNMQRRISVYVLVFLICWVPALTISIIKSKETLEFHESEEMDLIRLFPLYVLQAALTPLQGFFNTIVYGWSRRSFRQATRPTAADDYYVPTPEFTSSYYDSLPTDYSSDPENNKETEFDPDRKKPLPF